jgi:16S rRNA (cytidine1402-2'-O)-methyltransferase
MSDKNIIEQKKNSIGKLFLCGTPIGNMRDITLRCLDILKQADIIACEDTRRTIKLLNFYNINNKKLVSYHEHNKIFVNNKILNYLLENKIVVYVSDAGMPCICDPGVELVDLARKNLIDIEIIPGPCAISTAIAFCGVNISKFIFIGFIDINKKSKREKFIRDFKFEERVLIFYESPHEIINTIKFLEKYFCDRKIFLARELTKVFQDYFYGNLSDAIIYLNNKKICGEFVVLLFGCEEKKIDWSEISIEEHLNFYLRCDYDLKSAIKKVSCDRSLPKNDIYSIAHDQRRI